MSKKLSTLLIVCAMLLTVMLPKASFAETPYTLKMADDYTWTITFNENVKTTVINRSYVYIADENGKKLDGYTFSRVSTQGNTVKVMTPANGYEEGKTYTLVVTNRFAKATGESFNVSISESFTVGEASAPEVKPEPTPEQPAPVEPTPPTEKPSVDGESYSAQMNDDYTWTVRLQEAPKTTAINRSYVYIGDENGKKLDGYTFSRISISGNNVNVAAPAAGYEAGKTYTLVMTERFAKANNDRYGFTIEERFTIGGATPPVEQPTPTEPEPTPEQPAEPEQPSVPSTKAYDVVNIASNGKMTVHSSYSTFNEAKKRVGVNQAVTKNGKIIAMKRGFIQTKAANGNVLTRVYADAALTKERTYLPTNVEIAYVDATERSIQVNVAGQEGYISHDNAIFKPFNAYFTRNYYANVNGELAHYVYAPSKNSYDSYTISAAPQFMVRGVKYYSTDGATFTDAAGNVIGTSYPYYQVASIRTQTKFTAAQIDRYIQEVLKTRGSSAVQKSKIRDLGATLVSLQSKYNINALAILSMAQHESAYGMSDHALKHNNLFGLNVTDNGNPADTYPSVANNIETLVIQYLEKKYLPPTSWFPNGSVFGNKDYGMNVKYASDPYWGSKIAGHYYRMMNMMSTLGYGQDKRYPVGRLTEDTVQTYKFSGLTQPAFAYEGTGKGKFVLILEEGPNFYKITSDASAYKEVFIRKNVLEKVATH